MKRIVIILISALMIPTMATGKDAPKQLSVDVIQILKISPQDQRAVIKTADGKMMIIKPGDVIDSRQETVDRRQAVELKVVEIVKDRVVFEEKKGEETEKIIMRLVDGKQKVERMRKTGEKAPQLYAPR